MHIPDRGDKYLIEYTVYNPYGPVYVYVSLYINKCQLAIPRRYSRISANILLNFTSKNNK